MKLYSLYDTNELLHLVAKDDETAFTDLYSRFWKKLFTVAYNRLKEIQTAEDVVHDVFTSLWFGRKHIEIKSLENYLATAVKYSVLNKIRKMEKERIYQKVYSAISVTDLPAETSLHYKRILEIIQTEVENLPEKCRLIFKYSRNEGKPVKQIARELNISPKTVENQLTKALKQLKLATRSFFSFFV